MKMKKIMSLSLAACLALSPIVVTAQDIPTSETELSTQREEKEMQNYIEFKGKISTINSGDKSFSILAENDLDSGMDKLIAHINEDVILIDDNTLEFIKKEDLKEGMEVSIYYSKDTIMLLSYPGQLKPNSIIVRNREDFVDIKVDRFDKDLVSEDNMLKLNINEDVEIVDRKGNKLSKEDLYNNDLIVFFTASTRSIPAQTTPEKIVVLKDNSIKVFDKVVINGEEVELESPIYENKDGIAMIPLREVAEKLGYKLVWDSDTQSVELTKEAQWTMVTIGKDSYNFAKMMIELGAAPELLGAEPELKEGKTYVPIDFLTQVLMAHTDTTMDGILKITQ